MAVGAIIAGGADTGWTFYTPYSSTYTNTNVILMALGMFVAGFSSILTGLNFIVTTHTMRAPGLTWFRLPLFVWSIYATSLIMVLGTPVIAITLLLVALERGLGIGIFDPKLGGDPLLVPASVLVLFASGRVHHGAAEHGRGQRDRRLLLAEPHLRLHVHRVLQPGDRGARLPRVGASHVRQRPVDLRRAWCSRS